MRLQRLDLVRYGKFTDRTLDFGPARPGMPDLHLVYGPNEAGKSTLFSAFLDLLFGIEARSGYGFQHPYQTMRIGGVIELGGRTQMLSRVKRNQNSLLDQDDQPLPDGLFASALAGIDRATYQMMFSLDDDSIEKGGEAILKSEGELGALLFSASSGLPDSSAVLAGLRAQADAFYKPQGRKHRLGELKAELDALKDARNTVDTNAREFALLRKARDSAVARCEEAFAARAALRVAFDRARAQMDGLPLLARLRTLRTDLAGFADLREPLSAWQTLLPQLLRDETEIETRLDQIRTDIARLNEAIAAIEPDDHALAQSAAVQDIERSDLEARHRTAARDMPSRRDERAKVNADLALCLAKLGRAGEEDPASLLLPAALEARIRDLTQKQAALAERYASALRERDDAEEAGSAALDAVAALDAASAPDTSIDLVALSDELRLLRQNDCVLRQKEAARQVAARQDDVEEQLARLAPYAGDADGLAAIAVPVPAELAVWATKRGTLDDERLRLDDRIAEETLQLAAEEAQHARILQDGSLIADAQAVTVRESRDRAWQRHLDVLDAATASTFGDALRTDDEATAIRLAQSDRLAQMRGLTVSVAARQARLSSLSSQHAEACDALAALDLQVSAAALACGLSPDTTLARLEAWLQSRVETLRLRTELRAARQAQAAAVADEAEALQRLARAVAGLVTLPDRLDAALAGAERALVLAQAAQATHRAAREETTRAQKNLRVRESALSQAKAALEVWQDDWRAALQQTWLADDDTLPPGQEVVPVLAVLRDVDKFVLAKATLDHRIDAMEKDQRDFAKAVHALAGRLAMPETDDPLLTFDAVRKRLAEAGRRDDLLKRLAGENEARRTEETVVQEARARHDALKRAMLDHFDVESLADVNRCLDIVRSRGALRERIAQTEADLAARLGVGNADEAEMQLAAIDEPGLRLDMQTLQTRLNESEHDAGELHAARRDAERALAAIGGDDAAAFLDERRRTVLAEIEDSARAWLRLRTGILAGENALRLYRERHRSAMMQRASAAFSTISGGDYEGLATQADKNEEFLIAKAAGGSSKLARDLSKGTRFQLYLALRLAGYHEVAATRDPVPFVADDIMETFDDSRTFHAFRLMADMAKVGQVIYLTHHEHLCAIATAACPSVSVHRL